MTRVRFLLDENQSPRLKAALVRLHPEIDVLRVGDPAAPSFGTTDADLLKYLDVSGRVLITSNRSTMPAHMQAHAAGGGQVWGILWVRRGTPVGKLAEVLHLIWEATAAEEWLGREGWIPF